MSGITIYDSRDEACKSPYGAVEQGTEIQFTFRPPLSWGQTRVTLVVWHDLEKRREEYPMRWMGVDPAGGQEQYETLLPTDGVLGLLWYHFRLETGGGVVGYFGNNPSHRGGHGALYGHEPPGYQLTVFKAGQDTPTWYGSGVTYHIFPDRFHHAGPPPKVKGLVGDRIVHEKWDDTPDFKPDEHGIVRNRDFFGGNAKGILEKLPYLRELGVSTIYLSPVFEAASNHRYDTADYHKIDPLFGTEEDFSALCREAKALGIRVLLDGVFNHTGSNSRYFNAEGFYPGLGAHQSKESPYYPWYDFSSWPREYASWWGIDTLPQVNESHPDYIDFIIEGKDSVIRHWLRAGASGWRLDVADELPDDFIRRLRQTCREENPESVVIGEVWEDASNKESYSVRRQYLLGRELDGLMNYPFRDALLGFLLGSDAREFVEAMECQRENYPRSAFYSGMNILGTHDTPRALTVLGCDPTDFQRSKEERAELALTPEQRELAIARLKIGSAVQFSFPGSPCVYYGDEAGMEGFEDPFNRRGYPWGEEDKTLLTWYHKLGAAYRLSEALQGGSLRYLFAHEGLLVFERKSEHDVVVTAVNAGQEQERVCDIPWPGGMATDLLSGESFLADGGRLTLRLGPLSAMMLV